MAEGATRAKGVPEGLPVGWIAPEGAIMDLGDLAEMRDALRVGKHVTVASDGHVYVSAEPTGQPMTPEAETFIEAKLGVVKEMVLMGGGMSIHPDGTMAGAFADQHIKVNIGPDRTLDADELQLIHAGIKSGATVAVLPDGSVQYLLQPGTQAPTGVRAKEIIDFFDEEVRSGRFLKSLEDGNVVRLRGDQYEEFTPPTGPTAPGMDFPEPGPGLVPPPPPPVRPEAIDVDGMDDPAELAKVSDALDVRATELRNEMAQRLGQETTKLGTERDAAARREYSAQQEAAAAKQQVLRETKLHTEERKIIDRLETEARALEAKGNGVAAEEKREEARVHLSREAAAGDRSRAADEARKQLELEAKQQGEKVKSLEAQLTTANDAVKKGEVALDAMEKRADLLDGASKQFTEVKRLETDAAQRRAAGDTTGADNLQRQADGLAAKAYQAVADADGITIDPAALGAAVGEVPVAATEAAPDARPVTLPPPVFDMDDPLQGTAPRASVTIPSSDDTDPVGVASSEPDADPVGVASSEPNADPAPAAPVAESLPSSVSDPIPDVDVATQVAAIDASADALNTTPDPGFEEEPLFASDSGLPEPDESAAGFDADDLA